MSAKRILIGGLALVATGVSLYIGLGGRSQKINLNTYEVLGAVTAEETAKLLGDKGQVLVMVRDTGPDKNPSVEAQLSAFQKTLKKHRDLSVLVHKIQVTSMMMMSTGGGVPPQELFKALQTHADLGAIVLFFGFPQLADSELNALKKSGVKIVVVSSLRPGYEKLLERQAIHLALVPRPEPLGTKAGKAQTVREMFDREYMVLSSGVSPKSR